MPPERRRGRVIHDPSRPPYVLVGLDAYGRVAHRRVVRVRQGGPLRLSLPAALAPVVDVWRLYDRFGMVAWEERPGVRLPVPGEVIPDGPCVPAGRVLGQVHRHDSSRPRETACGLPMPPDEVWTRWAVRPGDRLCRRCFG